MKDQRPPIVNLTEIEQKLVSDIGALANMSLWKHVLKAGPGILLLLSMGALSYWIPSRMDSMDLRLCERRGSSWFPLAPTPDVDWIERIFWSMGGLFVFAAFITAGVVWAHVLRCRQIQHILFKAGVIPTRQQHSL
jgi:hypothetical protein